MAHRIRSYSPALLLDLGGHTADNHPVSTVVIVWPPFKLLISVFTVLPMPVVVIGGLSIMF